MKTFSYHHMFFSDLKLFYIPEFFLTPKFFTPEILYQLENDLINFFPPQFFSIWMLVHLYLWHPPPLFFPHPLILIFSTSIFFNPHSVFFFHPDFLKFFFIAKYFPTWHFSYPYIFYFFLLVPYVFYAGFSPTELYLYFYINKRIWLLPPPLVSLYIPLLHSTYCVLLFPVVFHC